MTNPTPTQTPKVNDRKLSQAESREVAEWLKQKGFEIQRVKTSLWNLRPTAIARSFQVSVTDILKAARRIESEE